MTVTSKQQTQGSTLLCATCSILILSIIGANVLLTCTTRYNVSSTQVRAWKQSLYAAESAGDIAYAEVRKTVAGSSGAFSGWTNSGNTHTSPVMTYGQDKLKASAVVDMFTTDSNGNKWYRIRATGIAPVQGLARVGMDDRVNGATRGDSLLRKIDFYFDHFIAAYGPSGDGTGKAQVPVSAPRLARRIELIAGAVTPFNAAVRVTTSFDGPGSAGLVDSYNSINGAYYFTANNPADPHYADSHAGSVAVDSKTFSMNQGPIWGDVSTNGGNVKPSNLIHGVIDNAVQFTTPPLVLPTLPAAQANPNSFTTNQTVTPPAAGSAAAPITYLVSSWSKSITFAQNGAAQTYVAVHLTGDFNGSITVQPGVHVQVFVDGNINVKARDLVNNTGLAGNLQFYGISPTDPNVNQAINIGPPGNIIATFYAPSAAVSFTGNPDMTGAIVAKSYSGNGNTGFHYDRALEKLGEPVDYRIASYVEDTR